MVEREITTTVAEEKEREVTETYIEETEITETQYICDACGEFCDERGGRREVPKEPIRKFDPSELLMADFAQNLRDSITDEIGEMEVPNGITRVRSGTASFNGNDITIANADYARIRAKGTSPWPSTEYEIRETATVVDTDDLEWEIDKAVSNAVNESMQEYEIETYDICEHCHEALEDTADWLDTAAYEPVEHDDSSWRDYIKVVYSPPAISTVSVALIPMAAVLATFVHPALMYLMVLAPILQLVLFGIYDS